MPTYEEINSTRLSQVRLQSVDNCILNSSAQCFMSGKWKLIAGLKIYKSYRSYLVVEVPSNIVLKRMGANVCLCRFL